MKKMKIVTKIWFYLRDRQRILALLVMVAFAFELAGWLIKQQSFMFDLDRLAMILLPNLDVGILALAMTMVMISGGIDLSVGSVLAAAAVVTAAMVQGTDMGGATVPVLAGVFTSVLGLKLLLGLAVGLVFGVVTGALVAYASIPPFIASLGTMVTGRGFVIWYSGGHNIDGLSPQFLLLGQGVTPIWIFFGLAAIMGLTLAYTRFGKFCYALGSNRPAYLFADRSVPKQIVLIYVGSALVAALAGIVTTAQSGMTYPTLGQAYELDAIAASVIGGASLGGGIGKIRDTVLGVLILAVIKSGFNFIGVDNYFHQMVEGMIIVLVVIMGRHRQAQFRNPGVMAQPL
ncbi:MAG: ABC transporter permease [Candidatus Symbiobacter sp.]|nr:ABC transporter permease [Candidatus Symbiobacter sp.]